VRRSCRALLALAVLAPVGALLSLVALSSAHDRELARLAREP